MNTACRRSVSIFVLSLTIYTVHAKNETGSLKGVVNDNRTNLPVADACVTITSLNLTDTTDADGGFSFENITIENSGLDYYLFNSSLLGYGLEGNSLVLENDFCEVNFTNTSIYASGTNLSEVFDLGYNNVFINSTEISGCLLYFSVIKYLSQFV